VAKAPNNLEAAAAVPAATKGSGALEVRRIQSSYMQVSEQLRDLIMRGDLAIGERLPSEAEMAPLFGVSRSTIREALRILVTDGLLVTRRGVQGGTFVAALDPARIEGVLRNAFNVLALTNQVDAADFLEAWDAIDVPAARLAAGHADAADLEELDRLSATLSSTTPRAERLRQSADFHFAMLAASGNRLLEAMGRPVSAVARARFSQTSPDERFWKKNTAEHRRIFEAIAAGDQDAAAAEAASHVRGLAKFYQRDDLTRPA
jgi:GntR family transcriptional regulator, transcriptional repressor for pyruvate dehydrogenase complex